MYHRNILIEQTDPELWAAIQAENRRQEEHIELIASENYASPAVMAAQGTQLTNKYAEGYPGKRYYGGCENVDVAEQLAIDRVKQLFGADAANVQAHSGSQANEAVFLGLPQARRHHHGHEPGRRRPPHPRHGAQHERQVVQRGELRPERQGRDRLRRDGAQGARAQAQADHRRRLGLFLRIDFERFAKVAKDVGAIFMVDMAHYAGLIAAGVYPNPVPHADVVTSTTHKSLRGPRGGIILMKAEHEKAINSAIFPGLQGGPLMHVIAAKAVAFKEALAPEFKAYQQQVVKNAQVVAETLVERGLRIVSGRTESHVMLVDLRAKGITGKEAEAVLGEAHMTFNKNAIPNDPEKPMVTSGVRIGTPAMTTRGFKEEEARATAHLIADVLDNPRDEPTSPRCASRSRPDPPLPGLRLSTRVSAMRLPCAPFCSHDDTQVVETRDGRRRRRHPPSPPVPGVRQALHHLRAPETSPSPRWSRRTAAASTTTAPSCAPR